jgi:monoamine oxidase
MKSVEHCVEIIVIGSGMSGVSTAQNFISMMKNSTIKYNLTILEARDRIGGRTYTKKFSNIPVDLGASWLEGYSKSNPLANLSEQYKLNISSSFQNSLLLDTKGKPIDQIEMRKERTKFDKVLHDVMNKKKDISYSEGIQNSMKKNNLKIKQEYLNYFTESFENYEGASLDTLSILCDSECGHIGPSVTFEEGYGSITEEYSKGLNIKLNKVVKKIDYSKDEIIKVETEDEIFEADFVVCTIPLGCLKKETIQFHPSLPKTKTKLIERMGMGLLDKVVLEFPKIFWGNHYFVTKLEEIKNEEVHSFLCMNTIYPDAPILAGFISAEFAKKIELMSDEEIVENAMKSLRIMFGKDIPDPISHYITRWWNDPFSYGSYSYDKVGSNSKDYDDLGLPIQNRLLFAGESTITRGHAFVNGAYLSGEREAKRLFTLLHSKKY